MPKYRPVDLSRHQSDILVIHCADPRFQSAYRQIIDGFGKYHDLLVVPGASKAIVNDKNLIGHIKLLHDLHHFEKVHIMDHIECGAFGAIEDEIKSHAKTLKLAADKIKEALPQLEVAHHLLGESGELTLE